LSDSSSSSRSPLGEMTTQTLVDHASRGDAEAIRVVCERLRPRLVRWAHGRLPADCRDLCATEDLVQDVIVRSLSNLHGFQQQGGGLLSYLCTGVLNRIRSEIRRVRTRPGHDEADETIPASERSPLETVIDRESEERYRRALRRLSAEEQELIVGRLELEMSFPELALHMGRPSPDAARMAVNRAIRKLAETLAEHEPRI